MKKSLILSILFIFSSILFLIFSQIIKDNITYITSIFIKSYLPSILPFLLITNIYIKYCDFNKLYNWFNKKSISFIFDIFIIFLCLISGIPSCGYIINELIELNIYKKEKGINILFHYSLISLPFIYLITNKNYIFIFILLTTSTISYLLTTINLNNNYIHHKNSPISLSTKIIGALTTIYCFITITILLSIPLLLIFESPLIFLILSLFETTFPSINLLSTSYQFITYFTLGFTSFSSIYQLKKTFPNLYIYKYIKKRLIIASLVLILMFIFYL